MLGIADSWIGLLIHFGSDEDRRFPQPWSLLRVLGRFQQHVHTVAKVTQTLRWANAEETHDLVCE